MREEEEETEKGIDYSSNIMLSIRIDIGMYIGLYVQCTSTVHLGT